jgi:dolichol kinase
MRRRESREPALGPVTLALGVLVSLWCLPLSLALACILVTAVADSAASVIGERWGRVPWPHNPLKSLEGTAAFLVSAVVCASVYLPLQNALLLAVIAAAMESLPLEDWDNFVTPVGTGMIAAVVLGM